MKSKRLLFGVFAAVFAFAAGTAANASVVSVFTVDPVTTVGGTAEVELTLNLFADKGFSNAHFTGGLVTLGSDNGQLEFFTIKPGTTTQTFSFDFAYPTVGSFNPFYAFAAGYSEQFGEGRHKFTILNARIGGGDGALQVTGGGESSVPAVPEIQTWLMLLLGFAGLGLVASRRKMRPAFRLA